MKAKILRKNNKQKQSKQAYFKTLRCIDPANECYNANNLYFVCNKIDILTNGVSKWIVLFEFLKSEHF